MKAKLKRGDELTEVTYIVIEINGNRYRLSETIDGKLTINKISLVDSSTDCISVSPRSGNEIDIS